MKLREILDDFPKFYEYDYKWKDSENYRDLNEALELLGFRVIDDEVSAGDYNDIKGYFELEIEVI